jgi:hypothetical protein
MSRGLGKTQKKVLRMLGIRKWKSLREIGDKLPFYHYKETLGCYPGSHYMSIYQAIKSLERRGLVEIRKKCLSMITVTGQHFASIRVVRRKK